MKAWLELKISRKACGENLAGGILEREGLENAEGGGYALPHVGGVHGLIPFCLVGLASAFAIFTDWLKAR